MPSFVPSALTTGLLIALIDAAALVAPGTLGVDENLVQYVDLIANIALYSYLGLRIGRATGVVRDAAEAGVLAALVAATIGLAVSFALGVDADGAALLMAAVRDYALNVALGGVLAVVNGWIGTKAHEAGSARRP